MRHELFLQTYCIDIGKVDGNTLNTGLLADYNISYHLTVNQPIVHPPPSDINCMLQCESDCIKDVISV